MFAHIYSIVALNIVKHWIALVFAVLGIVLRIFGLFLVEGLATLNIYLVHDLQLFFCSLGNQPSVVNDINLVPGCLQLLQLLVQQ